MRKMITKRAVAAAMLSIAALATSPAAMAELMTFTAVYGADVSSPVKTESAVLTFTTDTDFIGVFSTNTNNSAAIDISKIANLSLTIQGAPVGNGTYGASDFQAIAFGYYGALDFTKELVGQTANAPLNANVLPFGSTTSGKGGFFGLIGTTSTTPAQFLPFELQTAGLQDYLRADTLLRLTSLTAVPYSSAVPEPSSIAMMLAGLSVAGFMARRKRQLRSPLHCPQSRAFFLPTLDALRQFDRFPVVNFLYNRARPPAPTSGLHRRFYGPHELQGMQKRSVDDCSNLPTLWSQEPWDQIGKCRGLDCCDRYCGCVDCQML